MKKIMQSSVSKRLLWTLFLIFIYILGSRLTLPFIDLDNSRFLGGTVATLAFSTALTGGNLASLSLFSVGLSPWMSSMLLWQMFTLSKKLGLGNGTAEIQDRRRMYLTLVVALIQSLAVTLSLPIQEGINPILAIIMNTLILIAGTFFLVWLSDINSLIGLGGSIVILMASMVSSMPQNIIKSIQTLGISWQFVLVLCVLGLVMLYLSVLTLRARYRIPINKISIHNRFKRYSYLDIPINPAGGMPFMYTMSLVSLPQYILMLIQLSFPKNGWTAPLMESIAMGQPAWVALYILTLFLLSLAFSFVAISGEQQAERMQKSGDYIYGIYPGESTSRYINRIVLRFAIFGSFYTILLAGTPMLVVLINPQYLQLSMIPGMFLIFSGMIYNIKEEMRALTMNEHYIPLI